MFKEVTRQKIFFIDIMHKVKKNECGEVSKKHYGMNTSDIYSRRKPATHKKYIAGSEILNSVV